MAQTVSVSKNARFGVVFLQYTFGNLHFFMFALIARRSKYHFWIPDKILILEKKIRIKKLFFRDRSVPNPLTSPLSTELRELSAVSGSKPSKACAPRISFFGIYIRD